MGHESIDITYRYSHLFPSKQVAMADRLDEVNAEFEDDMGSAGDDTGEVNGVDISAESTGMTDSGVESEMIDLDAVNTGKKAVSDRSGKVLSIEKYRAV